MASLFQLVRAWADKAIAYKAKADKADNSRQSNSATNVVGKAKDDVVMKEILLRTRKVAAFSMRATENIAARAMDRESKAALMYQSSWSLFLVMAFFYGRFCS